MGGVTEANGGQEKNFRSTDKFPLTAPLASRHARLTHLRYEGEEIKELGNFESRCGASESAAPAAADSQRVFFSFFHFTFSPE